jgi:hypothetical protein
MHGPLNVKFTLTSVYWLTVVRKYLDWVKTLYILKLKNNF